MKTTFRKEMDRMEDFDLDESTVIQKLDIDTDKIVATVMQNVHTAPEKKSGRRKLPLLLIAAALSAAVIGTTVLAATGVFTPFSQKYDGDTSALTVYENDSFRFRSDNADLQASFGGFVGDEDFTLAAIELTNKDGSAFTDQDGILSAKSALSADGYTYRIDRPEGSVLSDGKNYYSDTVEYYLSRDKKTLTVYLTIENHAADVKGTRVSFQSRNLYSYQTGKKLDEFYTLKSSMLTDIATDEHTLWKYENGKYVIYEITSAPIPLPYEISFELDKKFDSSIKLPLTSQNAPRLVKPDSEVEMSISPFSISLKNRRTFTKEERDNAFNEYLNNASWNINDIYDEALSPFLLHKEDGYTQSSVNNYHSGLLMNDGTEYFFVEIDKGAGYDYQDNSAIEMQYQKTLLFSEFPFDPNLSYADPEDLHSVVVDPSKIAKIMFNNHIVYTAPGCEDKTFNMVDSPLLHQWSIDDFRSLLSESEVNMEFGAVPGNSGTPDKELGCYVNEFDVILYGDNQKILSAINRITREKENGLLIKEMTVYAADNHSCEVRMKLTNLYIVDTAVSVKTVLEHLPQKYNTVNWNQCLEDFLYKNKTPLDSSILFTVSETSFIHSQQTDTPDYLMELPLRQPMTAPAASPDRNAPLTSDLSKLQLRIWNQEDIRQTVFPAVKDYLPDDKLTISNDDRQNGVIILQFQKNLTRNGIYNLVNTLTSFETENLFISAVDLEGTAANDGTFTVTVKLINPAADGSDRKAKIINAYGHTNRIQALGDLFDLTENTEIEKLHLEYHSGDEGWIIEANLQTVFRKGGFNSFLEFRDLFENHSYIVSDCMSLCKPEKPEGTDAIRAANILFSYDYIK